MWHVLLAVTCLAVSASGEFVFDDSSYRTRRRSRDLETVMPTSCGSGESCVRFCCSAGSYLRGTVCQHNDSLQVPDLTPFPVYLKNRTRTAKTWQHLKPIFGYPCSLESYALYPETPGDESFYILDSGLMVKISIVNKSHTVVDYLGTEEYCLAVIYRNYTFKTVAAICFPPDPPKVHQLYAISMLLSTPFLLATFIVYAVVPELGNLHGLTLRGYVGTLTVAYVVLSVVQLFNEIAEQRVLCTVLAFIIHFSFLSSFFWLNVMCFDIWWTFGGFRSLQGSVKQRERKKFIMYSIYAWGCASLLTGICIIMDLVPSIPKNFIRPEFGIDSCWFTTEKAKAIYFYGPMGVTVLCNICLFISTALKIVQHKKDTAHHLKGSESRRHDDNKQWFNLYLKLFIVMGINWSMEIISWIFESVPEYVWYITDLTNTLQGLIIFIIFVWKDKIKRLLLKRLGCQDRNFVSRNSTRSAYHSSASRTCTTSFPMQEKTNPIAEQTTRIRPTIEESECN